MKTIKNISMLLALTLCLVGCKDTLTEKPKSYYDADKFFTSVQNAEMSVIGVYDVLADTRHYGQNEMAIPTSDDMYYIQGAQSDNTRRDISHYLLTTNNAWVDQIWSLKYTGIDRANFALAGIRGMTQYAEGNAKLLQYEGELCFLRAFIALDLVKYWGEVPLKTSFTDSEAAAYEPRSSIEAIYDQIFADLHTAKTQLPWARVSPNPERASQGAARALLMRAALLRAGYSLNLDGQTTRPSDAKRQEYFTKVVEEWEAITQDGYHGFFPGGYEAVWQKNSADENEPIETLWEIAFYTPDGKIQDAGTWGTYIGPLTDGASKYGRANAFFYVLPMWTKFYDDNDVRKDVNICQYQINKSNAKVYNKNKFDPSKPATHPDAPTNKYYFPGKWRREWMTTAPKDQNNTDVDYGVLRYPDVVLMAAEAMNELGRPSDAVTHINMVRQRAGIDDLKADMSNYAAIYKAPKVLDLPFIDDSNVAGKIRTALYWERGFELCFEGSRKFDLIRWGILKESMVNMRKVIDDSKPLANDHPERYFFLDKAYIAPINFETGKHELLPIPLAEINRNHKLGRKNNPQY